MTTRADVVQLVRSFVGLSISHDPNGDLARLIDFPGGPPPEIEVLTKTNCALFVMGIWREFGCQHPLLHRPYVNGKAMTWALVIASDSGALHLPHDGQSPGSGDVCHYATKPKLPWLWSKDDHLEFLVSSCGANRLALHAGGGRSDNAITEYPMPQDYTVNHWRPLVHWIDTLKVLQYATT
jgi:hypothetical protein